MRSKTVTLCAGTLAVCLVGSAQAAHAPSAERRSGLVMLRRESIEYGLTRVEMAHHLIAGSGARGGSEKLVEEVDCKDHAIRLATREVFARPGLEGQLLSSSSGQESWEPAIQGTLDFQIFREACEPAQPRSAVSVKHEPSINAIAAPAPSANSAARLSYTTKYDIQVGSFNNALPAKTALRQAAELLNAEQGQLAVEAGKNGAVRVYRAIVTGFNDRDEAAKACVHLQTSRIPCLVRRSAAD